MTPSEAEMAMPTQITTSEDTWNFWDGWGYLTE
jgi:hypothetical protein